ncbi:tape measure protein [[Haemophilus] ducreyi]|uniref:Tail length tape measure protein n=1 Tax=Haemophilus ducreyi (strain 35000HP / ATCC 700724) TaxID=233412 RepID=Q7VPE6_HAEDU|nr:tape measure domain-containing protein [[Haemophilus] ducreyi]AAP95135.1 putative tail length tape measure protein [[Haemophilus] ducreyi 35000HP]
MADNLTLALKIKTDLQNTLTDLKALESGLERNKKAAESVGKSAQTGAAGVQKLGQEADRANNKLAKTSAQIGAVSQQLSRLKTLVLGFTLGTLALGNFTQAADEYKNYETRVRLVSKSNAEAKGTFSELMQIANDTGAAFSATAELYTRLYRAMGNNANSAELLQFTRTIQQITAISGAGAEEAKAAIVQLAQGLASGALRGDEFNSVAEQMPILLEILQKSLGKTRAELRKMAEDGEITPQLILGATKQAQEEIQKQYDQMPLTLGRAVTQLSNSWLEFVGNTDKTTSASSIMAGAISGLAGNLKLLANIAIVAGAAYSVHLIAPLVKKTVAWGANTLAINANTAAQARGAQASTVTTGAVNRETVSVARLTQAYGALAAVKAKAAATSIGSGLLAFAGGWTGVAITAAIGLYAAYDYLKSKEEELDAQYQQTTNSVQANIDKTNSLIEARTKLGELGGFGDRLNQVEINNKAIDEAKKQLDELIAKRDQLLQLGQESYIAKAFNADELDSLNKKITALGSTLNQLTSSTGELADLNNQQLTSAFNAAMEAGGRLAEQLKDLGGIEAKEAQELLKKAIEESEAEMQSMGGELDKIEQKIRHELTNASMTAVQQLEAMRTKFIALGNSAGQSAESMDPFINKINEVIGLYRELDRVKQSKDNESYLDNLRNQAADAGLSARGRRDRKINNTQWDSEEQRNQALAYSAQIEADENRRKAQAKTARSSKNNLTTRRIKTLSLTCSIYA